MLNACFSHLYFCQSLHMLHRGLAVIADLLVFIFISLMAYVTSLNCFTDVDKSLVT